MIRFAFFFGISFLTASFAFSQAPLTPDWKTGDTLHYFITESELVDDIRISLSSCEVEIIILKKNEKRAILEAHLSITADPEKGRHWLQFFQRLQKVPFSFYFQPGDAQPFSKALQLEKTMDALDQVMLDLLDIDGLQPQDYSEIAEWLNQLKPKTVLPSNLSNYFAPLNKVFDKYGQSTQTFGSLSFIDAVQGCADTAVQLKWILKNQDSYHTPDTLVLEKTLLLDTNSTPETIQLLANCGKLQGLEVVVPIDDYQFIQEEFWDILAQKSSIIRYRFNKRIKMRFGDIITQREFQTRVLLWQ